MPNRLFRWNGTNWAMFEDKIRMTMNNFGTEQVSTGTFVGSNINLTQKNTFINNTTTATIGGKVIKQRQALSKVLKPKADN
jgi:hypothetical protein